MFVPIQKSEDGRFIVLINFDHTPPGFEDSFFSDGLYQRYQEGHVYGEYGIPDIDALTGNPTAQWYRKRIVQENRICFTLLQVNTTTDGLCLELRPYGPLGNSMREHLTNSGVQAYLKFRVHHEENEEDQMVITQILGADFTTNK